MHPAPAARSVLECSPQSGHFSCRADCVSGALDHVSKIEPGFPRDFLDKPFVRDFLHGHSSFGFTRGPNLHKTDKNASCQVAGSKKHEAGALVKAVPLNVPTMKLPRQPAMLAAMLICQWQQPPPPVSV